MTWHLQQKLTETGVKKVAMFNWRYTGPIETKDMNSEDYHRPGRNETLRHHSVKSSACSLTSCFQHSVRWEHFSPPPVLDVLWQPLFQVTDPPDPLGWSWSLVVSPVWDKILQPIHSCSIIHWLYHASPSMQTPLQWICEKVWWKH